MAEAFAELLVAVDTRLDHNEDDSRWRAAAFATPSLAARLKTAGLVERSDSAWLDLVAHGGYTHVTAELGGLGPNPFDGRTSAERAVTVTAQRRAERWRMPPDDPQTLVIRLSRFGSDRPWSVADFDFI